MTLRFTWGRKPPCNPYSYVYGINSHVQGLLIYSPHYRANRTEECMANSFKKKLQNLLGVHKPDQEMWRTLFCTFIIVASYNSDRLTETQKLIIVRSCL